MTGGGQGGFGVVGRGGSGVVSSRLGERELRVQRGELSRQLLHLPLELEEPAVALVATEVQLVEALGRLLHPGTNDAVSTSEMSDSSCSWKSTSLTMTTIAFLRSSI